MGLVAWPKSACLKNEPKPNRVLRIGDADKRLVCRTSPDENGLPYRRGRSRKSS